MGKTDDTAALTSIFNQVCVVDVIGVCGDVTFTIVRWMQNHLL